MKPKSSLAVLMAAAAILLLPSSRLSASDNQSSKELNSLIASLNQRHERIQAMQAAFTRTYSVPGAFGPTVIKTSGTLYIKGISKRKMDEVSEDVPEYTRTSVLNGSKCSIALPLLHTAYKTADPGLGAFVEFLSSINPAGVELVGSLSNDKATVIKLPLNKSYAQVSIDLDRKLVRKFEVFNKDNTKVSSTEYLDYKKVEGEWVATRIKQELFSEQGKSKQESTTQLDQISLHPEIQDKQFELEIPKGWNVIEK